MHFQVPKRLPVDGEGRSRSWPATGRRSGPRLEGKLHVTAGGGDTYFLNNAVHLLQQSLDATATHTQTRPFNTVPVNHIAMPQAQPSTPCSRTILRGRSACSHGWPITCSRPPQQEPTPRAGAINYSSTHDLVMQHSASRKFEFDINSMSA
jgi:hypothetical protein